VRRFFSSFHCFSLLFRKGFYVTSGASNALELAQHALIADINLTNINILVFVKKFKQLIVLLVKS
jgi:hypothetical protein